MPIRGVLFDIDDTLFDFSGTERAGLLAHLAAEGVLDAFPGPAEAVALWEEITDAEYARFLSGEMTFPEQQRARARRFLDHVAARAGGGPTGQDPAAWFARFHTRRAAAASAFDDAEPVLKELAPLYRLGVVSNSAVDHQRGKLESVGLLPYLGDVLVCSDEHGAAKPDPRIFLAGCAALGPPPHDVAYVGDRYTLDALGSRDAGLRAYWLDRCHLDATTDIAPGIRVIRSLHELPAALAG